MAELYRKSIIEKMSSVERTDKTMEITSPISWLALVGITIIIVVTVIWAFLGTIPVTVSGKGIVASPTSTNAVFIDESGTIVSIVARKGMSLNIGDTVLTYKTSDEQVHSLVSSQTGLVSDVLVQTGDSVKQGSEMIRISPNVSSNQVVVSYVSLAKSKKIERGMTVQVYLDSADSQTYGHMWGRVVNIDTHAASTAGMYYVLGSDNYLSSNIQDSGAVAAVTCELYPDDNSVSGYDWTNEKGDTLSVTNGSPVNVKIIVDEVKPIEKMFSKLKEIWGD
jgi:hypothetical protein